MRPFSLDPEEANVLESKSDAKKIKREAAKTGCGIDSHVRTVKIGVGHIPGRSLVIA